MPNMAVDPLLSHFDLPLFLLIVSVAHQLLRFEYMLKEKCIVLRLSCIKKHLALAVYRKK